MVDNKTPEEDFKRFEAFIEGMEDIEYEMWYRDTATTAQRNLADGLREEIDEEDADDLINTHRDALRRFYSRW
jgi:hypothetical protein